MSSNPNATNRQRLAAILAADAAGYSRLMAADEHATMAALDAAREVFRSHIEAQRGRVIDMAGDSVLAVFETAAGAVSAALAVQRQLDEQAIGIPADRRMRFRIGVHLGDVIEKPDGTVYGDGVNIAARLEGLAEPGGVTISQSVEVAVRQRVAAVFEDEGERAVKNIAYPVRTFRLRPLEEPAPPAALPARSVLGQRLRSRLWLLAAAAAAGALAIAAWAWPSLWRPEAGASAPPLSMAVLPLAAPSGSTIDAQFADALTQSLATALGQWRMAKVPAYGVTASAKGATIDALQLARTLDVRYLVAGEVRRSGERITLNARLIDANSGGQTWGDEVVVQAASDSEAEKVLLVRLSRRIRAAVSNADIRRAALQKAPFKPLDEVLRGVSAENRDPVGVKGILAGRKHYDRALEAAPDFVPALVFRAWSLNSEFEEAIRGDRLPLGEEMEALASRALAADRRNAEAWDIHSVALTWLGRWDEGLAAIARAEDLDPTELDFASRRAYYLLALGRPAETVALEERLIATDPPGDAHMARCLCQGLLQLGRYDAALPACERAGALDRWWFDQIFLIVAYMQTGDTAKAAIAKTQLLHDQPEFTITRFMDKHRSDNAAYLEQMRLHVLPALRKAGVPD